MEPIGLDQKLPHSPAQLGISMDSARIEERSPDHVVRLQGHGRDELLCLLQAPCSAKEINHACVMIQLCLDPTLANHAAEVVESPIDPAHVIAATQNGEVRHSIRLEPFAPHLFEESESFPAVAVHRQPEDRRRVGRQVLLRRLQALEQLHRQLDAPAVGVHADDRRGERRLHPHPFPPDVGVDPLPVVQSTHLRGGREGADNGGGAGLPVDQLHLSEERQGLLRLPALSIPRDHHRPGDEIPLGHSVEQAPCGVQPAVPDQSGNHAVPRDGVPLRHSVEQEERTGDVAVVEVAVDEGIPGDHVDPLGAGLVEDSSGLLHRAARRVEPDQGISDADVAEEDAVLHGGAVKLDPEGRSRSRRAAGAGLEEEGEGEAAGRNTGPRHPLENKGRARERSRETGPPGEAANDRVAEEADGGGGGTGRGGRDAGKREEEEEEDVAEVAGGVERGVGDGGPEESGRGRGQGKAADQEGGVRPLQLRRVPALSQDSCCGGETGERWRRRWDTTAVHRWNFMAALYSGF